MRISETDKATVEALRDDAIYGDDAATVALCDLALYGEILPGHELTGRAAKEHSADYAKLSQEDALANALEIAAREEA